MRNRFDQIGKKIGLSALGPSGLTVAQDEISPDACHADLRHEPDPARDAERARLGLLGRMASILCIIELHSGSPDEDEMLGCLGKLIAFRQRCRRDARKRKAGGKAFRRPFAWVVSAGRPIAVLAAMAATPARSWPKGVYFSPGVILDADGKAPVTELDGAGGLCRLGVVVASELPRDPSTLLVRLMAGGPLLPQAIADLQALPGDAHEHTVASRILLGLQHALGRKLDGTSKEQELTVDLYQIGERILNKARREAIRGVRKEALAEGRAKGHEKGREEGRAKGREEGREEGRLVQARAAVRRVLALRQLTPSARDEARIDRCTDLATLECWLEQALVASSATAALRVSGAGSTPARRRTARSA